MCEPILSPINLSSNSSLLERSNSTNSNNSSSSNNSSKIFIGIRKTHDLISTKDIFTVAANLYQMDRKEKCKKLQDEYISRVLKEGDIHYFKQQNFNASYKRTV